MEISNLNNPEPSIQLPVATTCQTCQTPVPTSRQTPVIPTRPSCQNSFIWKYIYSCRIHNTSYLMSFQSSQVIQDQI